MKNSLKWTKWYADLALAAVWILFAVITLLENKDPFLLQDGLYIASCILLAAFLGTRAVILLRHRDGSDIARAEQKVMNFFIILLAFALAGLVACLIVPGL